MIETMLLSVVLIFTGGVTFLIIYPIAYDTLDHVEILRLLPIISTIIIAFWSVKRIKDSEKIQKLLENNS